MLTRLVLHGYNFPLNHISYIFIRFYNYSDSHVLQVYIMSYWGHIKAGAMKQCPLPLLVRTNLPTTAGILL